MSTAFSQVLIAVPVPMVVATGGATLATWRPPKPRLRSGVQHVAPWFPSAHGDFESFFFGAMLIAMLILVPRGLVGRPEAVRS